MKNNTKTYFDALVNSTVELIRFDSSFKPADGEYPFGKETADCLQYFLSLAQSMGFETVGRRKKYYQVLIFKKLF